MESNLAQPAQAENSYSRPAIDAPVLLVARGICKSFRSSTTLENVSFTVRKAEAPVAGKVGLWSKTDSISDFADFTVLPQR